jgi:NAD(P)-dependent dehydrogenase (short-subunit alcohol dehydrogenase family)
MDLNLKGRVALVTGSTAGIGLATAHALALLGAKVAVNGRTQDRVKRAIDLLMNDTKSADFIAAPGDLSNAAGAAAIIRSCPDADILVNNAGIFSAKGFFDIQDEEWMHFFETNVLSGIRLARHYTPKMVKRGWGRVVFISSESGLNIPAEIVHYGITKTASLRSREGLPKRSPAPGSL